MSVAFVCISLLCEDYGTRNPASWCEIYDALDGLADEENA